MISLKYLLFLVLCITMTCSADDSAEGTAAEGSATGGDASVSGADAGQGATNETNKSNGVKSGAQANSMLVIGSLVAYKLLA
ncbi:unnamed protein product [Hymenolepis diminuta]|uniref:Uncharacterized protein n=1 Tax=Hymenolepis diminuta TaxID=6216 RepID=A0A564YZ53_HYMDI|nr:unnamed protein product [Hymenolepis diminuta]